MKTIAKKIVEHIAEIVEGGLIASPFAALHIINAMMGPVAHSYMAYLR